VSIRSIPAALAASTPTTHPHASLNWAHVLSAPTPSAQTFDHTACRVSGLPISSGVLSGASADTTDCREVHAGWRERRAGSQDLLGRWRWVCTRGKVAADGTASGKSGRCRIPPAAAETATGEGGRMVPDDCVVSADDEDEKEASGSDSSSMVGSGGVGGVFSWSDGLSEGDCDDEEEAKGDDSADRVGQYEH
jgi:hypothetical protein